MSGGHFNDNPYVYYRVQQFADELENEIENNNKEDRYGYSPSYTPEIIEILKKQIPEINRVAKIMKAIDYLYSGDYGEDNFIEFMNNEIK
jgi:hypothetical protein